MTKIRIVFPFLISNPIDSSLFQGMRIFGIYKYDKKYEQYMRPGFGAYFLIILLLITAYPVNGENYSPQVFILSSYNPGMSWNDNIIRGIFDGFMRSDVSPDYYIEYMDTIRISDTALYQNLSEFYRKKYRDKKIDIIVSTDDEAFQFLKDYRDSIFPDTKVVFTGLNYYTPGMITDTGNFTGIIENDDVVNTTLTAIDLLPETKTIYLINDASQSGMAWEKKIRGLIRSFADRPISFIRWGNLSYQELVAKIDGLEKDSIILLLTYHRDPDGKIFSDEDFVSLIAAHSPVPVFAVSDTYLNKGITGGKITSAYKQGELAGVTAANVLKGTNISSIPITTDQPVYYFDYQYLSRFNIPDTLLPEGSLVLNRPEVQTIPLWIAYLAFIIIAFMSLILLLLLYYIRIRRRIEEDLRRSQHRNAVLLGAIPDLMVTISDDGTILDIRQPEGTPGIFSDKDIISTNIRDSGIGSVCSDTIMNHVHTAVHSSLLQQFECEITVDGIPRVFEIRIMAYSNTEVLALIRDITARIQAEKTLKEAHDILEQKVLERTEELMEAKEKADAANKAKSEFLANMSHELRTPMNAILGYSQLMQRDQSLRPDQKDYISIIIRSGNHLLALINEILELAKIEARRILLDPQVTDIRSLLSDLDVMFRIRTEEKGLAFQIEGIEIIPRFIIIDENKLRQILINLIGNAIKFTESGGITVSISSIPQNQSHIRMKVEIRDTGMGIAEDEISLLFKHFEQTSSGKKIKSGTGLGLVISQEYVHMMGGEITVSSTPGKGSIFRFELEAETAPDDYSQIPSEQGQVIGLKEGQKPYKILIADDQEDSRSFLVKILEMTGFEVKEAKNGKEAVEMFQIWSPDFIWMDIRMPVMSGIDATRIIKGAAAKDQVHVVALTASALEEDRQSIMESGFDDFVRKPFKEDEIFSVMTKHLGVQYRYQDEKTVPAGILTPSMIANLPANLQEELYESVMMLDKEMILSVIDRISVSDKTTGILLRQVAETLDFGYVLSLLSRPSEGEE